MRKWRLMLSLAMGLCLLMALGGCEAFCWENAAGNRRITSDPPESYPEEIEWVGGREW